MDVTCDGIIAALPTPFREDGRLDLDSLCRVIDLFVDGGVAGLAVLGITGEVSRLNEAERLHVLDACVKHANGRVAVLAGSSAEGEGTCIELSVRAKGAGADALIVSPPRAAKLNSDSVVNHFQVLAQEVGIPIIVQDYPPVSGFFMEPALLVRIAREVPKATLFKLEDAPTPPKVAEIRARSNGLEIGILGGLGGLYFLEELVAGANGAMTGFPYPEMLVEVLCLFRAGKLEEAAETFYRYVPIMRFAYQQGVGVAIRKEILRRRGVLRNATIRAPGPVMDGAMLRSLDYLLASMRRQGVPWIS